MGFRASPSEAVMWRDGDLLFAFHTDFEFSAVDSPIFRAPMAAPVHVHVRHTALWQLDFRVDAPLQVVLWRPGRRPVRTTVPAPVSWSAEARRFQGLFGERYPGTWVPVPCAYADVPHLCLCPAEDELRTVLLETFVQGRLQGACHIVHAKADADTCRILADRVGEPCGLAELRNGDIVRFPRQDAHASSVVAPVSALTLLCLGLGVRSFASSGSLLALGVALRLTLLPMVGAVPASSALNFYWCPFRGQHGPLSSPPWRRLAWLLTARAWLKGCPVTPLLLSIPAHIGSWLLVCLAWRQLSWQPCRDHG